MSLQDNYREELRKEGVEVSLPKYKPKRDYSNLILALLVVAAAASYYLVFNGYMACTVSVSPYFSNNSTTANSFAFKCGVNSILYAMAITLVIAIAGMLIFKIYKHLG
jgi:hypothetical protein